MKTRPITIKDYSQLVGFLKDNYLLTSLDEYELVKLFHH